jgi:colicin import membrane protein
VPTGQRAGACRQHLGCVFRGIELRRLPAYLQPVDLHILKHDRRRPHEVAGDSACRTGSGHLVCERGIYAEDYAMWIVPERMADAVGPVVLEEAVQEGLKGPRSADIFSLLGR